MIPIRPATLAAQGGPRPRCSPASCCCRSRITASAYALVLGIDVLIAVLFATSLHFIMGPGGMHSFGHAAYFGLGAYGAALMVKFPRPPRPRSRSSRRRLRPSWARCCSAGSRSGSPAFISRLLTLAFAQIVWSILFQWEEVTGGSNGILGIWPQPPFDTRAAFLSVDACACRCGRSPVCGVFPSSRRSATPCGPGRDSALTRANRSGSTSSACTGSPLPSRARLPASPAARSPSPKGRSHTDVAWVSRSIDAMVMVLLGGNPDSDRAERRRRRLHGPAGQRHAPNRILARAPRRGDSCCWCWFFPGGIVGALSKRMAARRRSSHERAARPHTSRRLLAACTPSRTSASMSAKGEFLALIGPNGAGKIDLLQHDQRADRA